MNPCSRPNGPTNRTKPSGFASASPDTPFTRYNRLSNRFDNRFDNRLYRVNGTSEFRSDFTPMSAAAAFSPVFPEQPGFAVDRIYFAYLCHIRTTIISFNWVNQNRDWPSGVKR